MIVSCAFHLWEGGEGGKDMAYVYGLGLCNWVFHAFNSEWLRTENAVPMERVGGKMKER